MEQLITGIRLIIFIRFIIMEFCFALFIFLYYQLSKIIFQHGSFSGNEQSPNADDEIHNNSNLERNEKNVNSKNEVIRGMINIHRKIHLEA